MHSATFLRADHAPILILSGKAGEADRVMGLELATDDYVTKPFSLREFLVRIRANLSVTGLTDLGPQTLLRRETRLNGGVEGGLNVQLSNQADLSPPSAPTT